MCGDFESEIRSHMKDGVVNFLELSEKMGMSKTGLYRKFCENKISYRKIKREILNTKIRIKSGVRKKGSIFDSC